jgi:phenylacetate-CoA ligase
MMDKMANTKIADNARRLLTKIFRPFIYWEYIKLIKNLNLSRAELNKVQRKKLISLIKSYEQAVGFKRLKNYLSQDLDANIQNILNELPLQTKEDIRKNQKKPRSKILFFRDIKGRTGGSTGSTLQYYISNKDARLSVAMLYRGWSYAGYKWGDKIAVLAGGSMISKSQSKWGKFKLEMLGIRKYSSYGMNSDLMREYYYDMQAWKPKFLRGYVSSLIAFGNFIASEKLQLNLTAIFTTSEMLSDGQRNFLEKIFNCRVFNTYGLNDGSLTAFECTEHNGFHIDMERGLLQILDENGNAIWDRVGKIVAYALENKKTFFIKYDTGDQGKVSTRACKCNNPLPLIECILGRSTDLLEINGYNIGSPVLTVLMSHLDINRYQFIQNGLTTILLVISTGSTFNQMRDELFIKESLFSQVGPFNLQFSYSTKDFIEVDNGKWKVVINLKSPNSNH